MMMVQRTWVTSRIANRSSSDLNNSLALDCTLARSGVQVQVPDSYNVAMHVAQWEQEAQVAVVERDAHTVVGYRDDAGPDGG